LYLRASSSDEALRIEFQYPVQIISFDIKCARHAHHSGKGGESSKGGEEDSEQVGVWYVNAAGFESTARKGGSYGSQ
jgi:hypothetical protein